MTTLILGLVSFVLHGTSTTRTGGTTSHTFGVRDRNSTSLENHVKCKVLTGVIVDFNEGTNDDDEERGRTR